MRHRNHPIPSRSSGPRSGVVAALTSALLLLLLTSQWFGCSTPERRYRVLSFFFDGVPDPNAPKLDPESGESLVNGVAQKLASIHKPFAENQCDACHASASGKFEDFDKADDTACGKCHKDVQVQFAYMHGPVAMGVCRMCHSPHESSVPHLLNDNAPALCITCHDAELLPTEPPDHRTDRNCLECHLGHGSPARGLLRPGWEALKTAPSAQNDPAEAAPTGNPAEVPSQGRP